MRLLLGSGGFRTPERIEFFNRSLRGFLGSIDRLLFVPYALHDHDAYLATIHERGLVNGFRVESIHQQKDAKEAVRRASALFIGGGNTFRLLAQLERFNLSGAIQERVKEGMPYVGVSAGTNVACPTIQTTNDMPITYPASPRALNLVPFQINPHYFSGQTHVRSETGFEEHFGETRDDRLREFHEMNDVPVLGLWEAGILVREGEHLTLTGARARLFRKNQPSEDFEPGASLDFLVLWSKGDRSQPVPT
jgi:dipeptidase E